MKGQHIDEVKAFRNITGINCPDCRHKTLVAILGETKPLFDGECTDVGGEVVCRKERCDYSLVVDGVGEYFTEKKDRLVASAFYDVLKRFERVNS